MSWKDYLPAPNEIEYGGWPRETSLGEYADAATDAVHLVKAASRAASVYQLGGVRAPGISDLDFVVVLNEENPSIDLGRWRAWVRSLSPASRYILDTKPLALSPSLWLALSTLEGPTTVKHLSGPVLPPPLAPGTSAAVSHLFSGIERRLFATDLELRALLQGQVHVRRALKRLAKIKIQAMSLEEFGIKKPRWIDFTGNVTRLSERWFSLSRPQQKSAIYELLISLQEIDCEMILEVSGVMARVGMQIPESPQVGKRLFGILEYTALFVTEYSTELSLEYVCRAFRTTRSLISILPANFVLPVQLYGYCSSTLRAMLEDQIAVFGELPDLEQLASLQGIIDRVGVLEQYTNFVAAHPYPWARMLPLNMWHLLKTPDRNARRFWQGAAATIEKTDDVLPFVLREQLARSHPRLSSFVPHAILQLWVVFRERAEILAPPKSRRRRLAAWTSKALMAPFNRPGRKA